VAEVAAAEVSAAEGVAAVLVPVPMAKR